MQKFIIEPGSDTSANHYDVFRVPSAPCSIDRKRKNDNTQNDENKKPKIIVSPCLRNLPVARTMTVADLRKGLGL